ncbi:MAG: sugar ABC transporter substrate-binding protein [Spirochaetales bacterium]|jgi:ABC-type sugar transport system substrate-binding protein|nr:sugar ABC transporter substrate-binding protein [Spirochaetales bacterium]
MKKIALLSMAGLMVLLFAAGCSDDSGRPASSGAAAAQGAPSEGTALNGKGLVIGVSSQHLSNDFNRGLVTGIRARGEELEVELIMANAQGDSNKQVSDLENFLARRVNAVIIAGGEGPAFGPVMRQLAQAGIPCITIDVTSEYSICNVTSDNFNGGEQLALYVKNKLGGRGNILALDTPGWQSLIIRLRMLDTVIMDYPNLNVVQLISIPTNDAVNNYYQQVRSYLQANKNIQAIYCSWGLAAVGAARAVRELGLTEDIFVVCTDADQVVLQEMLQPDSPLTAVVGQYPLKLGSTSVEMAISAARGNTVPQEAYAPIILIEKYDSKAWFSAPAIMSPEESWRELYPDAALD